jgi:hypothetical protein
VQQRLFKAALDEFAISGEPVNRVLEIDLDGEDVTLTLYFGAASVARARERCLEFALDHHLDEFAHTVAHAGFDRIKPIVEKIDPRLGC